MKGGILNRAILTHLLVAVPPAVILGLMVASINESALRYEAQLLHLSTANNMKQALDTQVRDAVFQLQHAERVLSMDALEFSERQDLLRALVASGAMPYLLVFGKDGQFDASIHLDAKTVRRDSLRPGTLAQATKNGFALEPMDSEGRSAVIVPWSNAEGPVGLLGTIVRPSDLSTHAKTLALNYLGAGGRVQVIDASGHFIIGPQGAETKGTAFEGLSLSGSADGLTGLSAGISKQFIDSEGQEQLAALVSDPDLGWIIGTSRPSKIALASIARVHQRVLLMAIAAALLAGLVGLLLAKQISKPIQILIRAVRRTARANFDPDKEVAASGELGQLADAFNTAVHELAQHRMELRQTTQLRLRLSRLVSSAAMHDALATNDEKDQQCETQTVSVLYADVVLPTGQTINAEHLVTVLSEFFGAAHETMLKHGGHVDRYSGDAVIGIFTGPNPEGALAAAHDLVADAHAVSSRWQQYLGGPLSASVGIVTDEGQIRQAPDSGELSVSGPLVERAAAGQAQAGAAQILIDEPTNKGSGNTGKRGVGEQTWYHCRTTDSSST